VIYCLLTEPENRHFLDLYNGAGQFKLPQNASPTEKRQRTIDALASVLPDEDVREKIGADEVTVMGRGDLQERWRRS
jgi:hypothetical protein